MSEHTAISWCDSTFNPWMGCTKVSPACDNCYAEALMDTRWKRVRWGAGQPRVRTSATTWRTPLHWEKQHEAFAQTYGRRRRVFCASLADVFDNEVDPAWRAELFALIAQTPSLDWLLLTKRIGNVVKMIGAPGMQKCGLPPNVWLGATVINQEEAYRDIPKLLAVPAAKRFLSIEPMLLSVDVLQWLRSTCWYGSRPGPGGRGGVTCQDCDGHGHQCRSLHWVICGGESGPQARPMHPDWVRSLRDQCASAGVPFHFKQWGEWAEQDGDKPTRVFSMDSDIGQTLATTCDGFISPEGEFVRDMDEANTDDPYRGIQRVGTKTAGRHLDGVEHNGFPS